MQTTKGVVLSGGLRWSKFLFAFFASGPKKPESKDSGMVKFTIQVGQWNGFGAGH